jgi:coenzyme PQQ biosynthesis protein PqqD
MSEPIAANARPLLAAKVRLRFDRHSGRHMLLYPERGMELNESAARIAGLCTGDSTLSEIVARLHGESPGATREQIEADVQAFLQALLERALLRLA